MISPRPNSTRPIHARIEKAEGQTTMSQCQITSANPENGFFSRWIAITIDLAVCVGIALALAGCSANPERLTSEISSEFNSLESKCGGQEFASIGDYHAVRESLASTRTKVVALRELQRRESMPLKGVPPGWEIGARPGECRLENILNASLALCSRLENEVPPSTADMFSLRENLHALHSKIFDPESQPRYWSGDRS